MNIKLKIFLLLIPILLWVSCEDKKANCEDLTTASTDARLAWEVNQSDALCIAYNDAYKAGLDYGCDGFNQSTYEAIPCEGSNEVGGNDASEFSAAFIDSLDNLIENDSCAVAQIYLYETMLYYPEPEYDTTPVCQESLLSFYEGLDSADSTDICAGVIAFSSGFSALLNNNCILGWSDSTEVACDCDVQEGECDIDPSSDDNICSCDEDCGDDGPPECVLDCPHLEDVFSGEFSDDDACGIIVSWSAPGTSCIDDCDEETQEEVGEIVFVCETCIASGSCEGLFEDDSEYGEDCEFGRWVCEQGGSLWHQEEHCNEECGSGCYMVNDCDGICLEPESCEEFPDSGDGAPECLLDCGGIEIAENPEEDPYGFCNWVNTLDPSCHSDCDQETLDLLSLFETICGECVENNNCEDHFSSDGDG